MQLYVFMIAMVAAASAQVEIEPIYCGTRAGLLCPEGLQCTEAPREICNSETTADCPGICLPQASSDCDIMCNRAYFPVCGSDGSTYSNECELGRASCEKGGAGAVVKVADGECQACGGNGIAEACPEFHECGPNPKCNSTETPDCQGICVAQSCDVMCTFDYRPVCGSDGVTYSNECAFNRADCEKRGALEKLAEGACQACGGFSPDANACPEFHECGPDPNCDVELIPDCTGLCAATSCDFACSRIFRPVCGSDGVTYPNECVFRSADCKRRGALEKVADGWCEE